MPRDKGAGTSAKLDLQRVETDANISWLDQFHKKKLLTLYIVLCSPLSVPVDNKGFHIHDNMTIL